MGIDFFFFLISFPLFIQFLIILLLLYTIRLIDANKKHTRRVSPVKGRNAACVFSQAGDEGIEPPTAVLETAVIPLN